MTEQDVEIILQRTKECFPQARPRIILDYGPQFVSRGFKEYVHICGKTYVGIAPHYLQSNGILELLYGSLKQECIRPKTPLNLQDTPQLVMGYVTQYNNHRLHSAVGYITPNDKLQGRETAIFATRAQKLQQARAHRRCEKMAMLGANNSQAPTMAGA